MLSVDASGVVPVDVRPPPPLRGSSPCEADSFGIRMANKTAIMAAAWQTKRPLWPRMVNKRVVTTPCRVCQIPLNFDRPVEIRMS